MISGVGGQAGAVDVAPGMLGPGGRPVRTPRWGCEGFVKWDWRLLHLAALGFDDHVFYDGFADVFGLMVYGFIPACLTCLRGLFLSGAILHGEPDGAAAGKVDHVIGVMMHCCLFSGFERSFDDADMAVVEDHFVGVGCYLDEVGLGGCV
jgi:hypothetical protein